MKMQVVSSKVLSRSILAVGVSLASVSAFAQTPASVLSLAHWTLQLPTGSAGSPDTKTAAQLVAGYTSAYFQYDNSDGTPAVAFFAPDNGVTTANSLHPRSELREMKSDGVTGANWDPFDAKTHTLSTTVKVTDARHRLVVGQIHIGTVLRGTHAASTKPLMELYYETNGALTVGVNGSPTAGQTETGIGTIAVGTKFTYQIKVSAKTLTVYINGVSKYSKAIPTGFTDYGMYFKAGDYNQTTSYTASTGTKDKIYSLTISHV
ncbi:MAG: Alginate lyase 2 [Rhodocyclales bacterium]|nr:Alginate lyase 2 [Rhodocyclales bacterium]